MIVVTGAAGFIGSNLVAALNARGVRDILAVDNLQRADKFRNLVDCEIADYLDKTEFLERLPELGPIEAIFHQGACSDTMESDGRYMMANNYRYSLRLLDHATTQRVPLVYASSAAVYGGGGVFTEDRRHEAPLNVYGYSKFLFDQIVRRRLAEPRPPAAPVVGLRYFNVYGPREAHKERMASVAFHHFNQMRARGHVELFGSWDGWGAGEQSRDFVYVKDVVAVNLHFLDHAGPSGIFNCGTGRAQPFNDIATTVIGTMHEIEGRPPVSQESLLADGLLRYVEFPEALKGKYQSHTCADLTALRAAGCDHRFATVQQGVADYVRWLAQHRP